MGSFLMLLAVLMKWAGILQMQLFQIEGSPAQAQKDWHRREHNQTSGQFSHWQESHNEDR